ncbi:D-alanyl-D-alanine carboxypeptidase [Microbacterium sp. RU33B]|nr:D-alanyl-D-alanine carboxypeptidase [Microbacterium sp. RU33B]
MRAKTHRVRAAAALFGVLALVLTGCTNVPEVAVDVPPQTEAQLPEATAQELSTAVAQAMAAVGASGAVVGVWAPWSGEWVTGVGTQAIGGGDAVTEETPFRAAAMTRAMTCDALYVLADKGTVSLSDSVREYVSGVADIQDVTLEQLCDGTSGIGSYSDILFSSWLSVPERVWSPRELASYGIGRARVSAPGEAYRDSDAGYVLLGLALERATGKTASEILADEVFEPLALENTYLPESAADPVDGVLRGYVGLRDAAGVMNCTAPLETTTMSSSFGFTDSGVVTDIDDLGRYAQALATQALMPENTKRYAQPLPAYTDAPSWYTTAGGALQAGSLVGQAGAVPGYATASFADPSTGLTVAVVLNNSSMGSGPALALAWELAAIASKAPAASGETAPEAGLPWTAQQYRDSTAAAAVCPLPEAAPAEG